MNLTKSALSFAQPLAVPALNLNQVSKQYGALQALNGVSLVIEQGEFFALLGPNGAGKTTLIQAIAGLIKPTWGHIAVMGFDVQTQYRQARKSIGIVPQELVFDPFFTVRETLRFQSGYFGLAQNDAWIDELLQALGLTDKADTNMRKLSGGMKRRVMVAQALVHKPPVIVLDEPTAGVDVELRQSLWKFIAELNQKGHTILLTTHYLEEAETLCNRVAMLKKGEILTVDSTRNLLGQHAQQTLVMRTANPLPEALSAKAKWVKSVQVEDGIHHQCGFALANPADIEHHLAAFRQANIGILECSLEKPDLEDVFVELMQGAQS